MATTNNGSTMKLEVVMLPVADVDRARDFYAERVGFNLDHDVQPGNGMRVVQLTPPGSGCSIVMGSGMVQLDEMAPGSIRGLHLVVPDVRALREALIGRGVEVSKVVEFDRGIKVATFSDPDGNSWVLQEVPPGV